MRADCFFYRKSGEKATCAVHGRMCLFCNLFVRPVEGLDTKDHINLVHVRNHGQWAMAFGLLALIISAITLALKLFD